MIIDLTELRQVLFIAAVSLTRIASCFAILPFMGGDMLPAYAKNGIMLTLVFIIFPLVAPSAPADLGMLATAILLFKEMFIGLLIGFLIGIIFWTAEVVGFLIDNQRGASMASVLDPLYGHSTSPLGTLLLQLITVLFFATGGFLVFLEGLFASYEFWPVFQFYPKIEGNLVLFFLGQVDKLMKSALLLSSPILIAIFLTDLCLGLISRFVPQLNVFVLSMPIKSGIASFLLVIYLSVIVYYFRGSVAGVDRLIMLLRGLIQ